MATIRINYANKICTRLLTHLKRAQSIASSVSPPDEFIVKSPHGDCHVPDVTIPSYIFSNIRYPEKIALECGITGQKFTYKELYELSKKFGSALLRMGLRKGDVLAVIIPNSPLFPVVFLGAAAVGVTVSPANPIYTPEELSRQVILSNAKAVVSFAPVAKGLNLQKENMKTVFRFIAVGGSLEGWINLEDLLKDDGSLYKEAEVNLDDTILLPFSSGTTGLPKGVCLTHRNVVASLCQLQFPTMGLLKQSTDVFQERFLAVLPFFHIYGLAIVLLSSLWYGGKIVTLPRFEPELFLKTVASQNFSIMQLVPPILNFLTNRPEVKSQWFNNLHTAVSGAAPLGSAIASTFLEKLNKPDLLLQEGYGLTETTSVISVSPVKGGKIGSCGMPFPSTEVKVIDIENGISLPPGQRGELCVRGPQIMKGYLTNPEATKETIDENGWLHTGDIAMYDDTMQFYIVDRLKELIKVKGLQVAPNELEDLLRSHPAVLDAAVIGVPDDRSGELPRGYIVKKPGSDLDESQLCQFIAEKVSSHKQLAGGVVFMEAIPKSPTGKILRRLLKQS
ncbi:uncharacterized protein LOC136030049 [Artemia franciscana]